MKVAVVPAGQWGTTLGYLLAQNGHRVELWVRRPEEAAEWRRTGRLDARLAGVTLPRDVSVGTELHGTLRSASMVIFAPAARALREILREAAGDVEPGAVLVSACKSLEPESELRMSQVVEAELPRHAGRVVAISGPNFAAEVARGLPAATVAACPDLHLAEEVQAALMTPLFRVYTNPDIAGVELGGALKNIIAIAVGVAEGLGLGRNTGAALITRGLAEIARLGTALGANPLTFSGLSGLGDLVLTCTGDLSRNRQLGLAIGRGGDVHRLVESPTVVVEGVRTTRAARRLGHELAIPLPITEELHRVLFEGRDPREGVWSLMGRSRTHEIEETTDCEP